MEEKRKAEESGGEEAPDIEERLKNIDTTIQIDKSR